MNGFRLTALLFVLAAASFGGETNSLPTTITVDGITYSNITWRTVTPATVSIFHQTGVASIPLEKLPLELQERFGYDPQKAAAYRAQESVAAQQYMVEVQARERLREQRAAEALEAARKQQEAREQEAQAEQAKEKLAAIQKANANVEVIQLLHVDGGINPLPTGGYVAQLALTNQTIVCAHFDEDGRRFLEDASRKYAEWNAQQNPLEQQLQVQAQPGAILLYGGKGGVRVLGGGGYGVSYGMSGTQPAPATAQPIFAVYAVREDNSSCYFLKGSREAGQSGSIKQYFWE